MSLAQCLRALARVVRLEIWGSRTEDAESCQSAGGARLGRQEKNFTLFHFICWGFHLVLTFIQLCLNLVFTLFQPCVPPGLAGGRMSLALSASPCLSPPVPSRKAPFQPYRPCQTNGTKGFVRFLKPYRYGCF